MSKAILTEGAAPATPATGKVALYAKTDGAIYQKDDAGTETALGGGLLAVMTTKGDLESFSTVRDRLPVGSDTHVLTADSAEALGVKWSPVTAGSVDSLTVSVRKGSAGTITKGTPVYLDGYNASGYYEVEAADADNASAMPAIGVAGESITNASTVTLVIFGSLTSMDTSSFSVGDGLYVSDAGALTSTRPANADDAVQKVATVARSHVSSGVMIVAGAFRSNDIPNTMSDATFRVVDNADTTKEIQFQASGITTGTTRTITMPDEDVDLGDLKGYIGQNLQTGTTYTLVIGDAGKIIEMNNASANTLTIPANASVAFPVDTRIDIIQYGAGLTTVAITTDTLRGDAVSVGQYKALSLWKRASTEWVIFGGTTA